MLVITMRIVFLYLCYDFHELSVAAHFPAKLHRKPFANKVWMPIFPHSSSFWKIREIHTQEVSQLSSQPVAIYQLSIQLERAVCCLEFLLVVSHCWGHLD